MTYQEVLERGVVAISVSETPDMHILGLTEEHLKDAMTEIARYLLALGARLAYGGDLRQHGFTRLLLELVARYSRDTSETSRTAAVDCYLAWPVHIQMPTASLEAIASDFEECVELICLDVHGKRIPRSKRKLMKTQGASDAQWSTGLTSMRRAMLQNTYARIVVGGRVDHYRGAMPGIAEEALLSLQAQRPLFLIGGFGGCARDIASTIGLLSDNGVRTWAGRDSFRMYAAESLNNGLSIAENQTLARSAHIDQAIMLVLRGLVRIKNGSAEP